MIRELSNGTVVMIREDAAIRARLDATMKRTGKNAWVPIFEPAPSVFSASQEFRDFKIVIGYNVLINDMPPTASAKFHFVTQPGIRVHESSTAVILKSLEPAYWSHGTRYTFVFLPYKQRLSAFENILLILKDFRVPTISISGYERNPKGETRDMYVRARELCRPIHVTFL